MNSVRWSPILIITMVAVLMSLGCSGGNKNSPISPELKVSPAIEKHAESNTARFLLGLYQCRVNPELETIEAVPLREAMLHLNALRFLEPPPPVYMFLNNFQFDGQTIEVDIELRHPFPGLNQFTGFDVCGIVISSGSIAGFSDPDIVIAGEGDTRLVNADGLTRWWNPREFPYNQSTPIFGYIDGGKGTPDEIAQYTATLNGYKYFADGLGPYSEITDIDPAKRGAFSAGAANIRHYVIELDAGLVFNYAIDACWELPIIQPPVIPDSFPPEANREEPYLIVPEVVVNTLWYSVSSGEGGGEVVLDVHCYDWFDADKNTVRVESPGVFDPTISDIPIGGTELYSTYQIDLINPQINSLDPVILWVSAESGDDYQGLLPGKRTAAYIPSFTVEVTELQGGGIHLEWGDETFIDHDLRIIYNDIDPALIRTGDGQMLLSFFYWRQDGPTVWYNYPRYATSFDNGHTFGQADIGYWNWHSITPEKRLCWNGKYALGSDGMAFHSYIAPCGHTLHRTPRFDDFNISGSHSGTVVEHAGEMLYTSEGYPMMFGDRDGIIRMRRGDIPNIAGTGTWPTFQGTPYTLVNEELVKNYLSLARSAALSSKGFCHLIFWSEGLPYIRMISSTDISGTSWGEPIPVFEGLAELWVGAKDPSLWIDEKDGFHTLFAAEDWMGNYHLMYGYCADGADWDEGTSFTQICIVPVDDGMNDTHVVVFDAFDKTWVFIAYETGKDVWCRYKEFDEENFSDPIKVNEHLNATLPDIYPNGDTGLVFAYQADDGTGQDLTDVYYRLAWWVED